MLCIGSVVSINVVYVLLMKLLSDNQCQIVLVNNNHYSIIQKIQQMHYENEWNVYAEQRVKLRQLARASRVNNRRNAQPLGQCVAGILCICIQCTHFTGACTDGAINNLKNVRERRGWKKKYFTRRISIDKHKIYIIVLWMT